MRRRLRRARGLPQRHVLLRAGLLGKAVQHCARLPSRVLRPWQVRRQRRVRVRRGLGGRPVREAVANCHGNGVCSRGKCSCGPGFAPRRANSRAAHPTAAAPIGASASRACASAPGRVRLRLHGGRMRVAATATAGAKAAGASARRLLGRLLCRGRPGGATRRATRPAAAAATSILEPSQGSGGGRAVPLRERGRAPPPLSRRRTSSRRQPPRRGGWRAVVR